MTRRAMFLLVASVSVLAACSIHNRMFYLHRYAGEARRLEQEGRRFEANDYWGRASVKAESVLVHRNKGDDAAQAMAIRGEAMAALGQCTDALRVLGDALVILTDPREREYAALAQGQCQVQVGAYDLAAASVEPVTRSRDDARRSSARLIAGTAYRKLGQDSLALDMLAGINSREAQLQRAIAEASLGDEARANLLLDSLLARRDSSMPWDSLIDGVGPRNPTQASRVLDRLLQANGVIPTERVPELLYADGMRLGAADTLLQHRRFAQVLEAGPATRYGNRIRAELALQHVRAASSAGDLLAPLDSLNAIGNVAGDEGADSLRQVIQTVVMLADSSGPGVPLSDMRLFLAGELARDRLGAPRLADSMFDAIVADWPESPYAGKAWLAARQVSGDTTDPGGQFQDSPYVQMLRGGDGSQFAQLEDSLARFASTVAVARTGERSSPTVPRPVQGPRVTRQPGDTAAAAAPRGNRGRQPGRPITEPLQ